MSRGQQPLDALQAGEQANGAGAGGAREAAEVDLTADPDDDRGALDDRGTPGGPEVIAISSDDDAAACPAPSPAPARACTRPVRMFLCSRACTAPGLTLRCLCHRLPAPSVPSDLCIGMSNLLRD